MGNEERELLLFSLIRRCAPGEGHEQRQKNHDAYAFSDQSYGNPCIACATACIGPAGLHGLLLWDGISGIPRAHVPCRA